MSAVASCFAGVTPERYAVASDLGIMNSSKREDMNYGKTGVCKSCGGPVVARNPTGGCDHLYWPDNLTLEAKQANGYVARTVTVLTKR